MNDIALLGMNHTTASVDLRECIAFSAEEATGALDLFRDHPDIREMVLFSTCNRVEILMAVTDLERAAAAARKFIATTKSIPEEQFQDALYFHTGDAAVRHVFRVAASLDSMMVGEPQILGQIKEAYFTATRKKTSGVILNRLLHRAFFVAKRVRTETGIGDHAVSISYAAIELGKKIFGSLEGKKALLIGAGEMAELAVENLIRNRSGEILVANRTFERGLELANKFNGQAIRLEEIPDALREVDIIISSTGAREFVITRDQVKKIMRKRRNRLLFFIDIAVPRDIDPGINNLSNCYVYDIDDLKGVIEENMEERRQEAIKGERIVDEAVIRFLQWYRSLDVIPTIVALRQKLDNIAEQEVRKTLQSLNGISEKDVEAIHRMKEALVKKIMHDPTLFLKSDGCHGEKSTYLDFTQRLFNLDES
jgi:glutamyl-tRNA reductase